MEALDGHGDFPQAVRNGLQGIVLQRAPGADGEKWPPAFAGASQPATRYLIGLAAGGFFENAIQRLRGEPALHLFTKRIQIQAARAIVAGEVDHVPDPIEVHRGVLTVILKEGYGYARN